MNLTNSTPVTITREKTIETTVTVEIIENTDADKTGKNGKSGEYSGTNLVQVLCIWYPITFQKKSVQALFNSSGEANAIYPIFAQELRLLIRLTNVGAQKIDGTILDIYVIVIAVFLVIDKVNKIRFFKETFLLANVSLEVVFKIHFLTWNVADADFLD